MSINRRIGLAAAAALLCGALVACGGGQEPGGTAAVAVEDREPLQVAEVSRAVGAIEAAPDCSAVFDAAAELMTRVLASTPPESLEEEAARRVDDADAALLGRVESLGCDADPGTRTPCEEIAARIDGVGPGRLECP